MVTWFSVVIFEGFKTSASADDVNVALSENGAEPGFERAAPVEIAEKRALAAGTIRQPVKFCEERIGEFAGLRGSGAATEHGGGGGTQVTAKLADEMLPGWFAIFHTRGGESQVFEMQGGEVLLVLLSCQGSAGESFLRAALEGSGESLGGKAPAAPFRLCVEPLQLGRGRHQSLRLPEGPPRLYAFCAGWDVFLHRELRYLQYRRASNAGGILGIP